MRRVAENRERLVAAATNDPIMRDTFVRLSRLPANSRAIRGGRGDSEATIRNGRRVWEREKQETVRTEPNDYQALVTVQRNVVSGRSSLESRNCKTTPGPSPDGGGLLATSAYIVDATSWNCRPVSWTNTRPIVHVMYDAVSLLMNVRWLNDAEKNNYRNDRGL